MIRYADVKDLKEILEIVSDAKGFLKENGIDQWQGDYPNADVFIKDIKNNNLYVYEREEVMGFASIIFGNDITYNKICEGKWLSNGSYITIHRLAVKNKYKRASVATKLIEYASLLAKSKNIKSIRI